MASLQCHMKLLYGGVALVAMALASLAATPLLIVSLDEMQREVEMELVLIQKQVNELWDDVMAMQSVMDARKVRTQRDEIFSSPFNSNEFSTNLKCCCDIMSDVDEKWISELEVSYRCPAGSRGELGVQGIAGDPGLDGQPGFPGFDYPSRRTKQPASFGIPSSIAEPLQKTPYCFACQSGPPGLPGPKGQTGPVGSKGSKGVFGKFGIPGIPGSAGAMGDVGARGRSGLRGVKGPNGADGVLGSKGPRGVKGTVGFTGVPGSRGASGPVGSFGLPGFPGLLGAPGTQGHAGTDGFPGIQGSQGEPGSDAMYCPCVDTPKSVYAIRPITIPPSELEMLDGLRSDDDDQSLVATSTSATLDAPPTDAFEMFTWPPSARSMWNSGTGEEISSGPPSWSFPPAAHLTTPTQALVRSSNWEDADTSSRISDSDEEATVSRAPLEFRKWIEVEPANLEEETGNTPLFREGRAALPGLTP